MKVQSIQYEVDEIDTKNPYYSIVKKEVDSGNLSLWHKNKNIVRFTLIDSNEAFANALRRTFNDEMEVGAMFVHPSDLDTNDKFILPDNIIERVNLIPFNQTVSTENLSLSIKVSNDTGDIITIYSKDVKVNSKKGGQSSSNLFNQNIVICTLRPGKYLYLNNIIIKKKEGFINNVYTLGTHRYECINVDFTQSSLSSTLKDFAMEFRDNGNCTHRGIINMVYDSLHSRVSKVQRLISAYEIPEGIENRGEFVNDNSGNEVYIISNTNVVDLHSTNGTGDSKEKSDSTGDLYEIHIKDAYHTIGNIITKYVFLEDPSIELINYKLAHILKHKIIVTIKHSEYKKIIDRALTKFLEELRHWQSQFK